DESSLEEKQPAIKRHPAGHYQPPELTRSKSRSFSVNTAVNSEQSNSTIPDQIVLLRRRNMVLYSLHLNRQIATSSSQAARNDVQHWAVVYIFRQNYELFTDGLASERPNLKYGMLCNESARVNFKMKATMLRRWRMELFLIRISHCCAAAMLVSAVHNQNASSRIVLGKDDIRIILKMSHEYILILIIWSTLHWRPNLRYPECNVYCEKSSQMKHFLAMDAAKITKFAPA
ncbi:hypothetical protein X801_07968, partial [Opisthorchis viverrini]